MAQDVLPCKYEEEKKKILHHRFGWFVISVIGSGSLRIQGFLRFLSLTPGVFEGGWGLVKFLFKTLGKILRVGKTGCHCHFRDIAVIAFQ
jgi:hypothetical protein